MPEEVQADHVVASLGEGSGQVVVHPTGEQLPMQEYDVAWAAAVLGEFQALTIDEELPNAFGDHGHDRNLLVGHLNRGQDSV